jgi:CRISPR-associated protein Cmr2
MERAKPEVDWMDLVFAFLHDPPDKALDIRGHEARAARYLEAAVRSEVDRKQIKVLADIDASVAERLPMPTAGPNGERAIGPEDETILSIHPLSGGRHELATGGIGEDAVVRCISDLSKGIDEPQRLFLALWRLLPERLEGTDKAFLRLPADTRMPDHTIWNHLDTTAALATAEHAGGLSLLSFTMGPVQEFIAAARSVRDLWSGSMLLSWITFQGMVPVIEACGPAALIFPSLRGLPWVDLMLREKFGFEGIIPMPEEGARRAPSLPNRFLAAVPVKLASPLSDRCKEAARSAWQSIAEKVRSALDGKLSALPGGQGWSKRWEEQVSSYFSFTTSVIHRRDCGRKELEDILGQSIAPEALKLADAIPEGHRPRFEQKSAGTWQAMVEYSGRLMEAQRTVRYVPTVAGTTPGEMVPKKCSLMGSFEQVGPGELTRSNEFWAAAGDLSVEGVRIRRGERLCAVSLVKRFCEPAFLRPTLKLKNTNFGDTATVAAKHWLERAGILPERFDEWNGQWLHWPSRESDRKEPAVPEGLWKNLQRARASEPPPSYYAILMLDGDRMGDWLNGQNAPCLREVLHPKMAAYFEGLGPDARKALDGKRSVGPAMHAAISQALANFSTRVVPSVVAKHGGTLIYSGGDDVLALLPVESSLQCAWELYREFRGEGHGASVGGYSRVGDRDYLMMGPRATLSGGLAVVHYKADLRRSLDAARAAEKAAKRAGRDALVIRACRRSGEHSSLVCPWPFLPKVQSLERAFAGGASDRFAYHLAGERHTLEGLDVSMQVAELKRQFGRSEPFTRNALTGAEDKLRAGDILAGLYLEYETAVRARPGMGGRAFGDFVCLLQTASFLARGRD